MNNVAESQENMMEKMLEKGDQIRPKYDNFDWSKLSSS